MSGDTGGSFKLPGGPIGFALGAEYCRETNSFQEGKLAEQGYTFYNAIPTFHPPAFGVTEGFGKLRVPIIAGKPFFHELTLSGSGRVAGYKGTTGMVYAYNGGVDWAPVRNIRFRANYARAVRAPNLVDLYTGQFQNFAGVIDDPCSLRNIGTGTTSREANCRAAGVPVFAISSNYQRR